jgi:hypothetical protein
MRKAIPETEEYTLEDRATMAANRASIEDVIMRILL